MARVLMIVTASDTITLTDGTAHPTGFWAEELVELHRALVSAGHEVDIATPGGGRPTVDPASLDDTSSQGSEIAEYLGPLTDHLASPHALADVPDGRYDALALPGGHGPMVDLATDPDVGRLLVDAVDRNAMIAVLCHGPAALLSASRADGSFAFDGRRIAVFTDEEERTGGLGNRAPYFVASRLAELGAVVESGPAWSSTVVTDGSVISGQNPQSSVATARRLVERLASA